MSINSCDTARMGREWEWSVHTGLFYLGAPCRVASLAAKDHFLYASVKGIILCLNCETMSVVHIFDAYFKAVRSLQMIHYSGMQSKSFSRILSHDTSKSSLHSSVTSPLLQYSSSNESIKSMGSAFFQSPRGSESFTGEDGPSNSILISFGVGYKGTVRDCFDHPDSFLLPSEGSRMNHQPVLPDIDMNTLLLWSTEVTGMCRRDGEGEGEGKCGFDIPELDEKAEEELEMALPDDIVTGI